MRSLLTVRGSTTPYRRSDNTERVTHPLDFQGHLQRAPTDVLRLRQRMSNSVISCRTVGRAWLTECCPGETREMHDTSGAETDTKANGTIGCLPRKAPHSASKRRFGVSSHLRHDACPNNRILARALTRQNHEVIAMGADP